MDETIAPPAAVDAALVTTAPSTYILTSDGDNTASWQAPPKGVPLALTGTTDATRYVGGTTADAPVAGTFAVGDFVIGQAGKLWVCTAAGTPGTWSQVGAGGGGGSPVMLGQASGQYYLVTNYFWNTSNAFIGAFNVAARRFVAPQAVTSCYLNVNIQTSDSGDQGDFSVVLCDAGGTPLAGTSHPVTLGNVGISGGYAAVRPYYTLNTPLTTGAVFTVRVSQTICETYLPIPPMYNFALYVV